ncbi:MAG: 23S rRNA (uracil-5-)-methyltransferase RumA [Bdellovibrionales bacterium GWB1_55_8]|nr:MAG: 23S rRNA (uracil-5-)-methyltransferase RumA [Bdellovibrionales bacterium GWB1_55_8]
MTSICPYFDQGQCRSCTWIERDLSVQLKAKEDRVRETLALPPGVTLLNSVRSPILGFRNRAKMSVTGTVEDSIIGIVGESVIDEGQDLSSCPIHHPKLNELIQSLPAAIRTYRLMPYNIAQRRGELKGIIAFYSPGSGQMYLRFVLRSKEAVSRIRKLVPELQSSFPSLVCISANIQPVPHAILEGPEEIILTERSTIDHPLGAFRLKLAPQAFVQTNVFVATQLYQTAAEWISLARPEKMLELYCGQGAFSFFAAGNAGRILGIEINPEAVKTANATAQELGYPHVSFKQADATQVDSEIRDFHPDLILVNPPRRGLAQGIELIRRHQPSHVIYSSCWIESLSQDVRALAQHYRIDRIQLFDLFPHTEHFETLVWLKLI